MRITLYTIPDCPFCKEEKDYLTSKGLTFVEKDVQSDKDALAEMLEKSNKFAGVPFTLIVEGDKTIPLKGFTQSEFDAALTSLGYSGAGQPSTQVGMPSAAPGDAVSSAAGVGSVSSAVAGTGTTDSAGSPAASSAANSVAMDSSMVQPISSAPVQSPGVADPGAAMPYATDSTGGASAQSQGAQPVVPQQGGSATAASSDASSAPAAPTDPQAELNTLLQDLESKSTPPAGMPSATPQQSVSDSLTGGASAQSQDAQSIASVGTVAAAADGTAPAAPASGVMPQMPDFPPKQ